MRRILTLLLCVLLLASPVLADNAASSYAATASVSPSGSCQVVISAVIRLEEPVSQLTFPLGAEVSDVALNGGRVGTTQVNGITHAKLNYLRNQVGTFPITLHYTLDNVVETDEENRQFVRIPLLSGFKYPMEQVKFSVSMPGSFTDTPEFFSGYHEQDIERVISFSVSGVTISGSVDAPLKDSETLYMLLDAPEGMFPRAAAVGQSLPVVHAAMAVCAGLALLYWILTLRRPLIWPRRRLSPPQGLSAGNVGAYLVLDPTDLTLMVLHWAQLGYLSIRMDLRERVLLDKKMDMGNERSAFENRCFSMLFSRGSQIDAAAGRYARYAQQVRDSTRYRGAGLRRGSGNPRIFRLLACGVGLFSGAAMADCMHLQSSSVRIMLMLLLGAVTAFLTWRIQTGMSRFQLLWKRELTISLILAALPPVVGLLTGGALYGLLASLWAMVSGFLAAVGGRRTELGIQTCTELLGLRRFLRTASPGELQRILRENPDYCYELMPFALALDADRKFTRQLGAVHLSSCKWLRVEGAELSTAVQFDRQLRRVLQRMDPHRRLPLWKQLLGLKAK